jgi:hypothetical protein
MFDNISNGIFQKIKSSIINIFVFKNILLTWVILAGLFLLGLNFNFDTYVIVIALSIVAFLTKAFTGLLTLMGVVPFIGPFLVKILSLPIFWLINGLGYFASLLAIKKGHVKSVITYRIITISFLIGTLFGYVLARYVQ